MAAGRLSVGGCAACTCALTREARCSMQQTTIRLKGYCSRADEQVGKTMRLARIVPARARAMLMQQVHAKDAYTDCKFDQMQIPGKYSTIYIKMYVNA